MLVEKYWSNEKWSKCNYSEGAVMSCQTLVTNHNPKFSFCLAATISMETALLEKRMGIYLHQWHTWNK